MEANRYKGVINLTITKNKAFLIALLITASNIIGKVLGFVKDVLISYYYGASAITDSIFLAMSIPMLILGVFTSSTDSAVIPQYNRIANSEGKESADNNFSNILNSVLIIAFIISLLMLLFPNSFISIFAPGFNDIQKEYSIEFLRIFSLFGFMHIIYCFFSTYNTVYTRIIPRAILSFTTNLLVVISLLIYPDPNMRMLSIAYFGRNLLSAVIPAISALRNGYKHSMCCFRLDNEMNKFIRLFIPIMGVALLTNLNMFVDKILSSNMGPGSVSYINYASRLTSIFDSMILVGLGVIIIPILSQSRANNDAIKFNKNATQVIKLITIGLFPIVVICMMLSTQIIEVIYMRGEFKVEAVTIVSAVFFSYSPQILALPLQATLAKIFHSIEDTKTPFYINVISVGVNIILSILLAIPLGIKGIAIATSFSVILADFLLIYKMNKLIGWDNTILNFKESSKIIICIAITMIAVKFSRTIANGSLLKVIVGGTGGGIAYLASFALIMKEDFLYIVSFVIRRDT